MSYALLVCITSIIIGVLVHQQTTTQFIQALERNLENQADHLSVLLKPVFLDDSKGNLLTELQKASETQITLIRTDGKVLKHGGTNNPTERSPTTRPEVVDAFRMNVGKSREFTTAQEGFLHAAKVVRDAGRVIGVVRISLPVRRNEVGLAKIGREIAIGVALGLFVALILGALIVRRVMTPLNEIQRVARSMKAGNYSKKAYNLPKDEIGLLGTTLNRLGKELSQKVTRLRSQESRLRAILGSMGEGVIAVDSEDAILFCNRAGNKILGYQKQDLPGKKIWQFTELRELRELVDRVREQKIILKHELSVDVEGQNRALIARGTPFEEGGVSGIIIVFYDVTQIRNLERMRKDFVANVSHELKTPLTSIKGYVETLLDGDIDEPKLKARFLRKINDNVDQLTNLVEDLLQLSRIESEDSRKKMSPINWTPQMTEVLNQHELEWSRKNLHVKSQLPDKEFQVLGDPKALFQIMDNLVSNAIKYTPNGGEIFVRSYQDKANGYFEVDDTGMGIPEHEQSRIFERFYRVDKARSRAMAGTGLGLSIVKHLVQAMGGNVTVQSDPGKGSRFTVALPLAGHA